MLAALLLLWNFQLHTKKIQQQKKNQASSKVKVHKLWLMGILSLFIVNKSGGLIYQQVGIVSKNLCLCVHSFPPTNHFFVYLLLAVLL
jgi:hypothetical protein